MIYKLLSINISAGGIPKNPVHSVQVQEDALEGDGRNHDKHARPWRAVSILSTEDLDWFNEKGFDLKSGQLGENLLLEGPSTKNLEPGDILSFSGGVKLEVSEPRVPCYVLDQIDPNVQGFAWGHCGVMCWVLDTGSLKVGEEVTITGNSLKEDASPSLDSAIILAGGKSSRMGSPKEGVLLTDGRPMIEHIIEHLKPCVSQIYVSGACSGYKDLARFGIKKIEDQEPGKGPLGGIISALEHVGTEQVLIVACDQPTIQPYHYRALIRRGGETGVFFRTEFGEKLHPFPGIFCRSQLPLMKSVLEKGSGSVRDCIKEFKPRWVTIPEGWKSALLSMNSPEDLPASVEKR